VWRALACCVAPRADDATNDAAAGNDPGRRRDDPGGPAAGGHPTASAAAATTAAVLLSRAALAVTPWWRTTRALTVAARRVQRPLAAVGRERALIVATAHAQQWRAAAPSLAAAAAAAPRAPLRQPRRLQHLAQLRASAELQLQLQQRHAVASRPIISPYNPVVAPVPVVPRAARSDAAAFGRTAAAPLDASALEATLARPELVPVHAAFAGSLAAVAACYDGGATVVTAAGAGFALRVASGWAGTGGASSGAGRRIELALSLGRADGGALEVAAVLAPCGGRRGGFKVVRLAAHAVVRAGGTSSAAAAAAAPAAAADRNNPVLRQLEAPRRRPYPFSLAPALAAKALAVAAARCGLPGLCPQPCLPLASSGDEDEMKSITNDCATTVAAASSAPPPPQLLEHEALPVAQPELMGSRSGSAQLESCSSDRLSSGPAAIVPTISRSLAASRAAGQLLIAFLKVRQQTEASGAGTKPAAAPASSAPPPPPPPPAAANVPYPEQLDCPMPVMPVVQLAVQAPTELEVSAIISTLLECFGSNRLGSSPAAIVPTISSSLAVSRAAGQRLIAFLKARQQVEAIAASRAAGQQLVAFLKARQQAEASGTKLAAVPASCAPPPPPPPPAIKAQPKVQLAVQAPCAIAAPVPGSSWSQVRGTAPSASWADQVEAAEAAGELADPEEEDCWRARWSCSRGSSSCGSGWDGAGAGSGSSGWDRSSSSSSSADDGCGSNRWSSSSGGGSRRSRRARKNKRRA
jgi:hypothetical protein